MKCINENTYAHTGGKICNFLNRPLHEFLTIFFPFTVRRIALQNYYEFNYRTKPGKTYYFEVDSVANVKHVHYLIVMIFPFQVVINL